MPRPTYAFGQFHLDPDTRELRSRGRLVTIPPLAFDCLVYLLEHRDRAVGRDELMAAVWGKTNVTDDQLYHLVRNARRAIGERGDDQSAIRTLPRIGFRWVGELNESAPAGAIPRPEVNAHPAEQDKPRTRARRKYVWAAIAVSIAAVVLFAAGFLMNEQSRTPGTETGGDMTSSKGRPLAGTDAIAVLPVTIDGTAGTGETWMRLGMMDFIIHRLQEGGTLVVPSDNIVAAARNQNDAAPLEDKVRAATGACCIVHASATRSDNLWVVHLELRQRNGQIRTIEARAQDAIEAARTASDQLLVALGRTATRTPLTSEKYSAEEWYQRAEAAVLRDDFEAARALLESAPEPIRSAKETRIRLASIDFSEGRYDTARHTLSGLLTELPEETEPVLRARAQVGIAAAGLRLGDVSTAVTLCTQAIAGLITLKEPRYLARAYNTRGAAHAAEGKFELAAADFSSARIAFQLAGDSLGVVHVEGNEGALVSELDRAADALPMLERAAVGLQRFGAPEAQSVVTGNLILAHLQLLQPAKALAVASGVGTQFDDLRNPHWLHEFRGRRALALMANGRITEARTIFDQLARSGDPAEVELVALAKSSLARLDLDAGRPDTAAALALQAVNGLMAPDSSINRRMAWLTEIRALARLDKPALLAVELARFTAWAETSADPSAGLLARLSDAEQIWNLGQRDEAMRKYEQLLADTTTVGSPVVAVEIVASYATALIDVGKLERASAIAGQVARYADRDFTSALLQLRLYRALGRRAAWQTALGQVRSLAGERTIPASLVTPP